MSGKLFIVATPIGNLEDLTPRARQALAEVDVVAAEDTRHTGRLLSHIGVKTRLLALHEHNESSVIAGLIDEIAAGNEIIELDDAVQIETKKMAREWAAQQAKENPWFAKAWSSQQEFETLWKDAARYRNTKG